MPQDLDDFMKSIGAPTGLSGPAPKDYVSPQVEEDRSTGEKFARGVGQGLLGYIEAPAQIAEKGVQLAFPNFQINPFGLRDWAKQYRESVESSGAGLGGEITGTLAPLFLSRGSAAAARAPMAVEDISRMAQAFYRLQQAARAVPGVARAGRAIEEASPVTRFATKAGIGATLSQPVSGDNFVEEKARQFAEGAILGGTLGKLGGVGRRAEPVFMRGRTEPAGGGLPEPASVVTRYKPKDSPFGGYDETFEKVHPDVLTAYQRGHFNKFFGGNIPEEYAAKMPQYGRSSGAKWVPPTNQQSQDHIRTLFENARKEEAQGGRSWLRGAIGRAIPWMAGSHLGLPHWLSYFLSEVGGRLAGGGERGPPLGKMAGRVAKKTTKRLGPYGTGAAAEAAGQYLPDPVEEPRRGQ